MNQHTTIRPPVPTPGWNDATLAHACPADWPPVSPHDEAPIVYRDMHIHFGHESGVYVICLGEMVWAATWPELRAGIDQRLSTERVCAGVETVRS